MRALTFLLSSQLEDSRRLHWSAPFTSSVRNAWINATQETSIVTPNLHVIFTTCRKMKLPPKKQLAPGKLPKLISEFQFHGKNKSNTPTYSTSNFLPQEELMFEWNCFQYLSWVLFFPLLGKHCRCLVAMSSRCFPSYLIIKVPCTTRQGSLQLSPPIVD